MNREEIEALITTILYKYYHDYVEPLEKEYDALYEENKKLKQHNTRLKNKQKEKPKENHSEDEWNRLRTLSQKILEDNKKLRALNEKLMRG